MRPGEYRLVAPPSDPPVETDEQTMSAEAFGKAVHVQHGKVRIVIPWVVVAALITAAGTYYGAHTAQQATPPNDEVVNELRKLRAEIDRRDEKNDTAQQLLLQRVGALESRSGAQDAQLTAILLAVRGQK